MSDHTYSSNQNSGIDIRRIIREKPITSLALVAVFSLVVGLGLVIQSDQMLTSSSRASGGSNVPSCPVGTTPLFYKAGSMTPDNIVIAGAKVESAQGNWRIAAKNRTLVAEGGNKLRITFPRAISFDKVLIYDNDPRNSKERAWSINGQPLPTTGNNSWYPLPYDLPNKGPFTYLDFNNNGDSPHFNVCLPDTNVFLPCPPDQLSGWPECRYRATTFDGPKCRATAVDYKGVPGPTSGNDLDWFKWAQMPPKPLSCGTSCALAPSFCQTTITGGPSLSPTPMPSISITRIPTATTTPLPTITATPVAGLSCSSMNGSIVTDKNGQKLSLTVRPNVVGSGYYVRIMKDNQVVHESAKQYSSMYTASIQYPTAGKYIGYVSDRMGVGFVTSLQCEFNNTTVVSTLTPTASPTTAPLPQCIAANITQPIPYGGGNVNVSVSAINSNYVRFLRIGQNNSYILMGTYQYNGTSPNNYQLYLTPGQAYRVETLRYVSGSTWITGTACRFEGAATGISPTGEPLPPSSNM